MADITNFGSINGGNEKEKEKEKELDIDSQFMHIRVKKRNGRKCITTIENLDVLEVEMKNWKNLFKFLKKTLCCNGALHEEDKSIVLSGDQREKIRKYFVDKKLCKDENIKIHGF